MDKRRIYETTPTGGNKQSRCSQCSAIHAGKWVQMDEPCKRIRQLEHHICEINALGPERRVAKGFSTSARKRNHPDIRKDYFALFHEHQGASGYGRRFEKHRKQAIGKSRDGWNTKLHMVAASNREFAAFSLSPGNASDGPQGRKLLTALGNTAHEVYLLMDKAYEGPSTRNLAINTCCSY